MSGSQIQLSACRGVSPGVFFHPEGERGPRRRNRDAQAKAVCAGCPVVAECRTHALEVRGHKECDRVMPRLADRQAQRHRGLAAGELDEGGGDRIDRGRHRRGAADIGG